MNVPYGGIKQEFEYIVNQQLSNVYDNIYGHVHVDNVANELSINLIIHINEKTFYLNHIENLYFINNQQQMIMVHSMEI